MYSIFKPTGRITRRMYLVLFIIFYFINLLCLLLIWDSFQSESWPIFYGAGVVLIASICVLLIQAIKRLHDIGLNWKYALYLLIPPPINFIGFIWLAVKKGQDGTNEYGLDPRINDIV
ncbi:DUF805 domain-containing protein [Algoriphagus antarcticus]|uniref:Uncharacterized membrane protein YhaH (DUF805 family) n=1 Tax=Algoriphagus antarcticus TaxID=238540 RepID=A0A3E0DV47_9BACT|nr:DUF805 domain-containing protein [Algoriphagus antarcticus]REG88301.1 uncharacterized membrane protein YhaH (DUF805 family) [Algoriphagus antarcticus]